MKFLLILFTCLLVMSPLASQTFSNQKRVKTVIDENGDTTIVMGLEDARFLLKTIFEKKIVDSLLTCYITKDSINASIISFQLSEFNLLKEKYSNQELMVENLRNIGDIKEMRIKNMGETIKAQEKMIKKQKRLKILGFVGSAVLPIATLFFVLGVK